MPLKDKVSKTLRRSSITFGTFCIVILALTYYYTVYVPENREQVVQGKYASLTNLVTELKSDFEVSYKTGKFSRDTDYVNVYDFSKLDDFNHEFDKICVTSPGKEESEVIYQSPGLGLSSIRVDSILKKNPHLSGRLQEINVSGLDYIMFSYSMKPYKEAKECTLLAFILKDKLMPKIYKISTHAIVSIVLLFLLILLLVPLAKTLFASRFERLNTHDIFLSGVSILLITAFITMLYIYILVNMDNERKNFGALRYACDTVSKHLNSELTKSIEDVSRYHAAISQEELNLPGVKRNTLAVLEKVAGKKEVNDKELGILRHQAFASNKNYKDVKRNEKIDSSESYIKHTIVLNSEGVLISNIGDAREKDLYTFNYSERKYFKWLDKPDPNNINLWHENKEVYYAIDFVRSWISGEYNMVIATRHYKKNQHSNDILKPYVIASRVGSKWPDRLLLPPEMDYWIVDNAGNIKMGSNKGESLATNIFDQSSGDRTLASALQNRASEEVEFDYHNSKYRAVVNPIRNSPYLLVMYLDLDHQNYFNGQTICQTAGLIIVHLIGVLLVLFIPILLNRREGIVRGKNIFALFGPAERNIKLYGNYSRFLVVMNFIFLLSYLFSGPDGRILLLMGYGTLLGLSLAFFLSWKEFEGANFKILFLKRNKGLVFSAGLLFISLTTFIFMLSEGSDSVWQLVVFEVLATAVFIFFFIRRKHYFIPADKVAEKTEFGHFKIMWLFWMASAVIVPAWCFYGLLYNNEAILTERRELMHYYDQHLNKEAGENKGDTMILLSESLCNTGDCHHPDPENQKLFNKLVSNTRLPLGPFYADDNALQDINCVDPVKYEFEKKGLGLKVCSNVKDRGHIRMKAFGDFARKITDSGIKVIMLFLFICSLFPLYQLISYFLNKVVFLEKLGFLKMKEITNALMNSKQVKHLLVVGLPMSGKSDWAKTKAGGNTHGTGPIKDLIAICQGDMQRELQDIITHNYESVVIDHFEYDMYNFDTSRKKLEFLESLTTVYNRNLIVISTVHPNSYIELYNEEDFERLKVDLKYLSDKARWVNLFMSFQKIYYENNQPNPIEEKPKSKIRDWVIEETANNIFLTEIGKVVYEKYSSYKTDDEDAERIKESIVLNFQTVAHSLYKSFWESLSIEEKYVLFDLAQDGIVNSTNYNTLSVLYNKGLIRHQNGCLRLMNLSFQNFILTSVDHHELKAFEVQNSDVGVWSKIKTPAYLLIIATGLFVLITQKEIFNSIIAYVTAIGAMLPALLRVFQNSGSLELFKGNTK